MVTFETLKAPANAQQPASPVSNVYLSRVVTEKDFVERSNRLETSIQNQNIPEFCESKIVSATKPEDQQVWQFIKANFDENPRLQFLDLLGYSPDTVAKLVETKAGVKIEQPQQDDSAEQLVNNLNNLNTTDDKLGAFDAIAESQANSTLNGTQVPQEVIKGPFDLKTDESDVGLLTRTLLTGNIELSVEICLKHGRYADALILAGQGGPELVTKAQKRYAFSSRKKLNSRSMYEVLFLVPFSFHFIDLAKNFVCFS